VTSLALATLLHVAMGAAGGHSYADAHRTTTKTGKPMVVMVSAEWCGSCQEMEKKVLPQVSKHGLLQKVSFAIVNVDRERTLARKLIGSGPIPQLVMFRRTNKGWLRRRLVGGRSPEEVEEFIKQGIARDEAAKLAAEKTQHEQSAEEAHAEAKVAEKPKAQPASKR
jgi:thioredoxin-like negative regulator of GroEL